MEGQGLGGVTWGWVLTKNNGEQTYDVVTEPNRIPTTVAMLHQHCMHSLTPIQGHACYVLACQLPKSNALGPLTVMWQCSTSGDFSNVTHPPLPVLQVRVGDNIQSNIRC